MGSFAGIAFNFKLKPWDKLNPKMTAVAAFMSHCNDGVPTKPFKAMLESHKLDARMFNGFSGDHLFNWDATGHMVKDDEDAITICSVVSCRSGYVGQWQKFLDECSWSSQFELPDEPTVIMVAIHETPTSHAYTRLTLLPCGFITTETHPLSAELATRAICPSEPFKPLRVSELWVPSMLTVPRKETLVSKSCQLS
ncbi:hypothetical protein [Vibrio phage BONAISHI]|nr:hypothetical protein [Vibrio phage BONAISHI]